ncbi:MAG: DnaA regulatory inactivator Hda [Nitrosomonas sp.]|nr:DnaA regulatory inactivator Hda [Nitrosomonas sp.]
MQQLLLDIAPPASPTLDNFLPGRNNELCALLRRVATNQEQERFIYIWGDPGCGKSHLLQAMTQEMSQKGLNAAHFPCKTHCDFNVDETINGVMVDDVDLLDMPSQIKLFNLYNQIRDESNAFLIVSGQLAPAQLNLRQDLVTRLGWGLVYRVHELMDEEKIRAMTHHATHCGFDLPQEVCDYLLRHQRRDLLSLIGTIDALGRYSLANKRQITVPLLRELLQGDS